MVCEKTIAILGEIWWPQTAKEEGDEQKKTALHGRNALSAQALEASLLGVGMVLRLERDAWSMDK